MASNDSSYLQEKISKSVEQFIKIWINDVSVKTIYVCLCYYGVTFILIITDVHILLCIVLFKNIF